MPAGPPVLARNRRAVSVVAASALMAVMALAALAINDSTERTELVYRSSLDILANPAAGTGSGGWGLGTGSLEETYTGENSDAPGIPSSYMWATTNAYDPSTGETGIQEGHGKDWIYTDGPESGPLKGARSHYYNEFKWDSDPETGGDFAAGSNVPEEDLINENFVANERSNPDHHTSEPYTHESSYGVLEGGIDGAGGKSAVENILNFDPWLMQSNGVY